MMEFLGSFFGTIATWFMDKFSPKPLPTTRVKVLIVDDAGKPLDDVQNFFKDHHNNYDVIIASSVETAKKQLEDKNPHYAVIDLSLDNSSREYEGFEVIKFIFDQDELITRPMILSGYKPEDVEKHLDEEFAGFPKKLEELKRNYIYKGTTHSGGYLVELLEKLNRMEKEKASKNH